MHTTAVALRACDPVQVAVELKAAPTQHAKTVAVPLTPPLKAETRVAAAALRAAKQKQAEEGSAAMAKAAKAAKVSTLTHYDKARVCVRAVIIASHQREQSPSKTTTPLISSQCTDIPHHTNAGGARRKGGQGGREGSAGRRCERRAAGDGAGAAGRRGASSTRPASAPTCVHQQHSARSLLHTATHRRERRAAGDGAGAAGRRGASSTRPASAPTCVHQQHRLDRCSTLQPIAELTQFGRGAG
jgi:hypothetical protein